MRARSYQLEDRLVQRWLAGPGDHLVLGEHDLDAAFLSNLGHDKG